MLKNADVDAKKNGYWVNTITTWKDYGIDMHTNYKKVVEGLNAENMQQFIQQVMAAGNQLECIMMPEAK